MSDKSVLGNGANEIPVGGKIRAGIMILTKTAEKDKKAVEIYNKILKEGRGFGAIEAEIKNKLKLKNPLYPKNVSYFTIHRHEFVNKNNADQIMKLYGEEGQDGYRLYRFPIYFPLDNLHYILPHKLKCHTKNQLKYWSEYDANDNRICMMTEDYQKDSAGNFIRTFGGRPKKIRGNCIPEKCPEYQNRQCTISGKYVFYIPQISGAAAISISTKSFYSLSEAREKLKMVAAARQGKVSGVYRGEPIFFLTKKLSKVSMMDQKTGQSVKVNQWLIELEANIDMGDVFKRMENSSELIAQSKIALEAPETEDDEGLAIDYEETKLLESVEKKVSEIDEIKKLRAKIFDVLPALNLTAEIFSAYYVSVYGKDWAVKLDVLTEIYNEAYSHLDNEDSLFEYRSKIEHTVDSLGG